MSGTKKGRTVQAVYEERVSIKKIGLLFYSMLSIPFYFSAPYWIGSFSNCKETPADILPRLMSSGPLFLYGLFIPR
jgi:hypothetical protein